MATTKIATIGVGSVGAGLGERLAKVGHEVVFGVRPGRNVKELLSRCGERARAASVREACGEGEVIFLAVPAPSAVEALKGRRPRARSRRRGQRPHRPSFRVSHRWTDLGPPA